MFDILRKLRSYSKFKAVLEVLRMMRHGTIKFDDFELSAAGLLP